MRKFGKILLDSLLCGLVIRGAGQTLYVIFMLCLGKAVFPSMLFDSPAWVIIAQMLGTLGYFIWRLFQKQP